MGFDFDVDRSLRFVGGVQGKGNVDVWQFY